MDGKGQDAGKLAPEAERPGEGLLSTTEGAASGRRVALATLATLRRELGSLDRVASLVKTLGLVNATPGFVSAHAIHRACTCVMHVIYQAYF